MARRKNVPVRPEAATTGNETPIDVATIGQGVGNFETINGMPHGIVAAALAVGAILLLRPLARAFKAFLRS